MARAEAFLKMLKTEKVFVVEEQALHQHRILTGVKVSHGASSSPGWRFEASCPGFSAPVHPHVVECWEDKRCEAVAESAHDCIDCVCIQRRALVRFSMDEHTVNGTEGVHCYPEKRNSFICQLLAAGQGCEEEHWHSQVSLP